jgi:hypothetical protein
MKGYFRFEISGDGREKKPYLQNKKTGKKSPLPSAMIRILARSFKRKVTPLSGRREPECKISGSLTGSERKTGNPFDLMVSPAVK